MLGIPPKTDKYTKEKLMLNYARLLVEIPLEGNFPDFIEFANEKNVVIRQKVYTQAFTHCMVVYPPKTPSSLQARQAHSYLIYCLHVLSAKH